MDDSRKKTIIKEILFWKEHNMLPGNYCDFLLAMYQDDTNEIISKKPREKKNKLLIYLSMICLILCLAVFVIYFTELAFILQTVFLAVFVVLFLILGIYYFKKEYWYFIFFLGSALLLLLTTIYLNDKLFHNDPRELVTTLIINCILWLLAGWKLKLKSFLFAGIIGIITIGISIAIY
jgi:hypothetical protein